MKILKYAECEDCFWKDAEIWWSDVNEAQLKISHDSYVEMKTMTMIWSQRVHALLLDRNGKTIRWDEVNGITGPYKVI